MVQARRRCWGGCRIAQARRRRWGRGCVRQGLPYLGHQEGETSERSTWFGAGDPIIVAKHGAGFSRRCQRSAVAGPCRRGSLRWGDGGQRCAPRRSAQRTMHKTRGLSLRLKRLPGWGVPRRRPTSTGGDQVPPPPASSCGAVALGGALCSRPAALQGALNRCAGCCNAIVAVVAGGVHGHEVRM